MFVRFVYDAYVEERMVDGEESEYVSDVALGLAEVVVNQSSDKIESVIEIKPPTVILTQAGKDLKTELMTTGLKPKYRAYFDGTIGY